MPHSTYTKFILLSFMHCLLLTLFTHTKYASAYTLPSSEVSHHTVLGIWDSVHSLDDIKTLEREDVPKGGTLKMSASGAFDNFNPFAGRGIRAAYMHLVYETLGTSVDSEGFFMQGLIAKKFTLAKDRSFMLVELHENASFSDNTPLTADDVVYTFNALIKEASPHYRAYYAQVKSVEAKGKHAVLFTFSESHNRELPLIICQLPVLPKHWWEKRNLGEPQTEIMPGSGPYRIKDYKMGSRLVFERRKDWWGKDLPVNKGQYNFDFITVDYYRDNTVAREAFFAGDVDFFVENTIKNWIHAYNVPAVKAGKITKHEQKLHKNFGLGGIFMNTRNSILQDKKVRQALDIVFDFEWTNRALFYNAYKRFNSIFTGSSLSATNTPSEEEKTILSSLPNIDPAVLGQLPKIPQNDGTGNNTANLRKALSLLKDAGWNLQNGVMVNEQGKPLTLSLILTSQQLQRVFLPYQNTLKRLGIQLNIELIDQTQYVGRVRAYDYDLMYAMAPQSDFPGNEQRQYWSSQAAKEQGTRNYAGIRDKNIDYIIEKLIASESENEWKIYVSILDRLIQHGNYIIYGWYSDASRYSWWNERILPPTKGLEYGIDIMSWYATKENIGK